MFSKFKSLNILKTKSSSNRNFEINQRCSGVLSAISWEHPWFSLFLIVIINIGFGFVKIYDWDICSVIVATTFVLTVYDNWLNVIQASDAATEHCEPSSNSDKIKKFVVDARVKIDRFIYEMYRLHKSRKWVFASIMITFCGVAVLINRAVSGFWLTYLALVTPLLFPLIYVRILPDTVKEFINHYTKVFRLLLSAIMDNYNSTDDDFMPEMSEETMNNLNEAYKLLLDGKNEAGEVTEEIDLNDLSTSNKTFKTDFLESSSVSSSGRIIVIDASSTDDDVPPTALTVDENKSTEQRNSTGTGLLSTFSNIISSNAENFGLIGYNLMNTVIYKAKQRIPRSTIDAPATTTGISREIDSSDDEFEIIDERDLRMDD